MAEKNNIEMVREEVEKLMGLLGISGDCEVAEKDGVFEVVLKSDDSGVVIGHHGDTLDALQLVISLCLEKKLGEFRQVTLDIGDYKKNRMERLRQMAEEAKEKALSSGGEVSLPMLKPWERRVIHLLLQEDGSVFSESIGEDRDRVLVIKPK